MKGNGLRRILKLRVMQNGSGVFTGQGACLGSFRVL